MVTKKMLAAAVILCPALAQAQPEEQIEPYFNNKLRSELEYVVRTAGGSASQKGSRGILEGELDLHLDGILSLHPSFLISTEVLDYIAVEGLALSNYLRPALEFRIAPDWSWAAGFFGFGLAYRRDQDHVFIPGNIEGYNIDNGGGFRLSAGLAGENLMFAFNSGLYIGERISSYDSVRNTLSGEADLCFTPRISILSLPLCAGVAYNQLILDPEDRMDINLNFYATPGIRLDDSAEIYAKLGATYMPPGFLDYYTEYTIGGGLIFAAE
ncbi:MAG: hypothetical protein AABX05_03645 [Nanoarchaeota archaeon]